MLADKWIKVSRRNKKKPRKTPLSRRVTSDRRCTRWTRCDVFTIRTRCRGPSMPGHVGHATYPMFTIKDGAELPGHCPQPTLHPIASQSWARASKMWNWARSICSLVTTEDSKAAEADIWIVLGSSWGNSGNFFGLTLLYLSYCFFLFSDTQPKFDFAILCVAFWYGIE